MIGFMRRNLKVFLRDKASVMMSLLTVFIIMGLHVFFLGDVYAEGFDYIPSARQLMDSVTMAGLIGVTSVSTTMGVFGIMISDKIQKVTKDFYSSPIKKQKIAGGYILSAFLVGTLMSLIALIIAQIYIVANGGSIMSWVLMLKVLGLIILAVFVNTAIVFFIASFFKSINAFSTASTVVGTLIGFLTGIYLPIGMLPDAVQWIIKIFPVSHAAALIRQVMVTDLLKDVPAEIADGFSEYMGVTFKFGNHVVTTNESILILVAAAALFYGLAIYNVSRKQK